MPKTRPKFIGFQMRPLSRAPEFTAHTAGIKAVGPRPTEGHRSPERLNWVPERTLKEVKPRSRVIRVTVREDWLFDLIEPMVEIRLALAVATARGKHLGFAQKKYMRLCADLDAAILKIQKLVTDARLVSDQTRRGGSTPNQVNG